MAPTESTTVSKAMTAMGRPVWTARLIVPTSRVTRVTRSPVLAPSTRLSGSRKIVSTTYSRIEANRFWPNSVEVSWPAKVNAAWATTTATITSASEPRPAAGPGDDAVDELSKEPRHGERSGRCEGVEHHECGE